LKFNKYYKFGFIFLLLIILFPFDNFVTEVNPYSSNLTSTEILFKSPKNLFLSIWFVLFGLPNMIFNFKKNHFLGLVFISCLLVSYNDSLQFIKGIIFVSFIFYSKYFRFVLDFLNQILLTKFILNILFIPFNFTFPYNGLNENVNKVSRETALTKSRNIIIQFLLLFLIFITESRGGLLLFLSLTFFNLISRKLINRLKYFILLTSLFCVFFLIDQTVLTSGRNLAWIQSLVKYSEAPIFGSGMIDYLYYLWNKGIPSVNFHNSYLEIFVRFGLVGGISFLTTIFIFIKNQSNSYFLVIFISLLTILPIESFIVGYSIESIFFWGILTTKSNS
jgi:hypothetical protein